MRHQTKEQRMKFAKQMDIANILGLIREGRTKEAIEVAANTGFNPKQFGKIASFTDSKEPISEIVKTIYKSIKML